MIQDTGSSDDYTQRLIRVEEEKSEKLINYWRFALSFYFFFITLIISKEIPIFSIYTLYIGATVYFFFSLFMLFYLRAGKYKPATKYLNIVVDILLISVVIWMFGTFRTFKNEAFLLYFMWIALGSMRFSFHLTLFTGALCAVCYSVIVGMGLFLGTIETGTITQEYTTEKVSMLNQFVKITYLIFVTMALSYGSRAYTKLARKSRQQEMEAERQRMKAQKLDSIGFLAGGIAHDFNNILAIISNNLHVAKLQVNSPDKALKKLNAIQAAADKATGLTQQLLTFSKGGAPVTRTIKLDGILEDAARLAFTGSSVRHSIVYHEGPDAMRLVNVDEAQINQVLSNLFINAIQVSEASGSTVEIAVSKQGVGDEGALPIPPGEYLRISVTDHGPGIQPENLQKIFDPYFTTKKAGHGLGLATAYSIVKRHKGYLWAESPEEGGAVFNVMLPVSSEPYVYKSKMMGEIGPDSYSTKLRILIMDDEQAFLDSTGEALELSDHKVFYASDGQAALDMYKDAMAQGDKYDIVIMDLTIPGGMGGAEAIKRLLKIDPSAKAIVASGYSNDPVMGDYTGHGFKGILPKPFSVEQMRKELQRVYNS